jgi:pimeloyl-ACP methyl ester carboxylesterase
VAIMHGWGGNADHMLPFAALLHAAGHATLLLDARNHGSSDSDDFSSMPRFAEAIALPGHALTAFLRRCATGFSKAAGGEREKRTLQPGGGPDPE